MMLALKQGFTYGPVRSRRLGRSLGINVLPSQKKACTLNCVYCQYGWTPYTNVRELRNIAWPSPDEVLDAVERELAEISPPPAYLTFSGNGEPTLHPDFGALVDGLIELRNRLSPNSKTAILSNSTFLTSAGVAPALAKLDLRILKLDAGNSQLYREYNRPLDGRDLDAVVAALQGIKDITIQTLFTSGPAGNSDPLAVNDWILKVVQIDPSYVQLYTLDRPYPSKDIAPVSRELLEEIKGRLKRYEIRAGVY